MPTFDLCQANSWLSSPPNVESSFPSTGMNHQMQDSWPTKATRVSPATKWLQRASGFVCKCRRVWTKTAGGVSSFKKEAEKGIRKKKDDKGFNKDVPAKLHWFCGCFVAGSGWFWLVLASSEAEVLGRGEGGGWFWLHAKESDPNFRPRLGKLSPG